MSKENIKEVIIEGVTTKDFSIYFKEKDSNATINRLDKRDWKAVIFCEYSENRKVKFKKRQEINVMLSKWEQFKENEEIIIKYGLKSIIGSGKIKHINKYEKKLQLTNLKIYIKDDKFKNSEEGYYRENPKDLFRPMDKKELKNYEKTIGKCEQTIEKYKKLKTDDIEKYINKMYKIYYDMLIYTLQNNNTPISNNKMNAICSYMAIQKNIKGWILSPPNCFIKNIKPEYDAIILEKAQQKEAKYIYDLEEVKATIEIKTGGIIYYNEKSKEYIEQQRKAYTDNPEYNKLNKNIKHVYFSFHESNSQTGKLVYFNIYKDIKKLGEDFIPIFLTTKIKDVQYVIPLDWDLDEILKLL